MPLCVALYVALYVALCVAKGSGCCPAATQDMSYLIVCARVCTCARVRVHVRGSRRVVNKDGYVAFTGVLEYVLDKEQVCVCVCVCV